MACFIVRGFNMCQQVLCTPLPLPAQGDDGPPPLPAPLKEEDEGPLPLPAPLKEGDDGPPPLPAPLKEGDDGPPVAIYALCGPATDDRDVSMVIACGYPYGLTTSFEVGGVLLIELKTRWNADVSHMGGCGYSPNTIHMTRDTSLNGSTAWPVASMADM